MGAGAMLGYRTALWLAIAIALSNLVVWSAIAPKSAVTVCAVSLVILFGLWVQSNLIRYLGAVCMVVWAGVLIWPLVSFGARFINQPGQTMPPIPALIFFPFSAVLNLLTAGLPLLSKKFATEFAYEREHQPKYKTHLKRAILTVVIVLMLIATLNDIINLWPG